MQEIKALERASAILRYHTVPTIKSQTVGAHSHGVALWCMKLWDGCTLELLQAALMHDLDELNTGDIPSHVKKRLDPEIRRTLEVEAYAFWSELNLAFPTLTPLELWILKIADCVEGLSFCIQEAELGNRHILHVAGRYTQYIHEILDTTPVLLLGNEDYEMCTVHRARANGSRYMAAFTGRLKGVGYDGRE